MAVVDNSGAELSDVHVADPTVTQLTNEVPLHCSQVCGQLICTAGSETRMEDCANKRFKSSDAH
jgi:hypothetical protein